MRVTFPPTWQGVSFGTVVVGLLALVVLAQEALAPYIVGLIVVFLLNGAVGAVIQPQVQSRALDLHPAIILPVLVVGAALAGLLGAILALPVTAAGRQIVAYLLEITADPRSISAEATSVEPPDPFTA
jgi:predicted PurR-regulated permease PerM